MDINVSIEARADGQIRAHTRISALDYVQIVPEEMMYILDSHGERAADEVARELSYRVIREISNRHHVETARAIDHARRSGLLDRTRRFREYRQHLWGRMRSMFATQYQVTHDVIEWLKPYPETIERDGWTATLLNTTQAIHNEGKAMDHCIGTDYTHLIVEGRYIAFHITPPSDRVAEKKLPQTGFTIGYHHTPKKDAPWQFDQIREIHNHRNYCKDPGLMAFMEHLYEGITVIHGLIDKKQPATTEGEIQSVTYDEADTIPQRLVASAVNRRIDSEMFTLENPVADTSIFDILPLPTPNIKINTGDF